LLIAACTSLGILENSCVDPDGGGRASRPEWN